VRRGQWKKTRGRGVTDWVRVKTEARDPGKNGARRESELDSPPPPWWNVRVLFFVGLFFY
jgi:hypothetical protein